MTDPLLNLADLELKHDPLLSLHYAQEALGLISGEIVHEERRARALRLAGQAHAALGDYQQAYTLAEEARAHQERLDKRLEQQRLEVAFAELEYDRAQAVADLQREALREARAEVADLQTHLEARVAQRTQELQAANEELGSFARSLSHYLRTPMQIAMGHAALLEVVPPAAQAVHAGATVDAIGRMSDILDGLLRYAERHARPLAPQAVDLQEVLGLAWRDLGEPAQAVQLDAQPLPRVWGDPTALRLVFGNLLHNAVKYTAGRAERRIQVQVSTVQDMHVIAVRDNGIGFDPAAAPQLFQVFSRLPEAQSFEGLGLGLADVWRVVIAHDGHVRAEGHPGQGASFFVSLPVMSA
ncbi:sensor histidine kinase [Deinococcus hohokamensis]|uniref:histidine kinase n=1 Tax=Deinococcus hohokamensis TaxID=309883 RepID=A0ABV9IAY9_9DEIO